MELLTLNLALDPRDGFKSFNIDNICKLADKFYLIYFTEHERDLLSFELKHYKLYVSRQFPLIDKLVRLILTLPVSTATTEIAFSAMKLVKTKSGRDPLDLFGDHVREIEAPTSLFV
ncbi:hypothetical protein ACOSP7_031011 [Xanthoceras sorbifolium]